jgi:transcriptional regulator with XRE-family HTH domain
MNYEKLKKVVSDKGVTLNDLCQHIDMTESGFHAAVKNNSLKVKTIELIADYLDISVSNFFDENYSNLDTIKKTSKTEKQSLSNNVVEKLLTEKAELLQEKLQEKERLIQRLEKELDRRDRLEDSFFSDFKNFLRQYGSLGSEKKHNEIGRSQTEKKTVPFVPERKQKVG